MKNTFNYYKLDGHLLFSRLKYDNLEEASQDDFHSPDDIIYYLCKRDPLHSRKSFSLSSPSQLFWEEENLNILEFNKANYEEDLASWLVDKINNDQVTSINTNYPNWEELVNRKVPKKWRLNLLALGDVGSTLMIGLRLLGDESIESIGIYDRDPNKINRWEHELNQIRVPLSKDSLPPVNGISKDDLFDCDMFIFCASKGIPPVGSGVKDVRMAQFESNSKIIGDYARMAREENFKGIFAVVSDPVDLLCKVAFLESNKDKEGEMDFKGLSSDQIIGYGLGVMNARAMYYAEKALDKGEYENEGRVFGPHGQGLIVANSIKNYDNDKSLDLTDKTLKANLRVREFGYKPFIAPALSSGALSIIATIKGQAFYGSSYMNSVYMGSSCKLLYSGLKVEEFDFHPLLRSRIQETYDSLERII